MSSSRETGIIWVRGGYGLRVHGPELICEAIGAAVMAGDIEGSINAGGEIMAGEFFVTQTLEWFYDENPTAWADRFFIHGVEYQRLTRKTFEALKENIEQVVDAIRDRLGPEEEERAWTRWCDLEYEAEHQEQSALKKITGPS